MEQGGSGVLGCSLTFGAVVDEVGHRGLCLLRWWG